MHTWDLLLTNANLATMAADEGYGEIANAALAITGEQIAWASWTSGYFVSRRK